MKTLHLTSIGLFIGVFALLFNACSRPEPAASTSTTGSITIKGSDTMVHLASMWAEDFMGSHPGIDVSVTGGGSGTGIAALFNGTTDIAASSRDLKQEERDNAANVGKEIEEFAVALDGLAIVVHPENPINELSMGQLKQIFTGAVTNWSQLGGPDEPIQVLSRESSSGTYVFFQEHVLEKENYTQNARLMPATSTIMQTIGSDVWSIGYVGLGYVHQAGASVKAVPVKMDDASPAVPATVESVLSGAYPIARPLFLLTAGEPTAAAKSFIDYTTSEAGRKIVVEEGYVPVSK